MAALIFKKTSRSRAFSKPRSFATENTYTAARLEALFSSQSAPFSVIPADTIESTPKLGRSSNFCCLLLAVSQSILFTQMQICFSLGRSINFLCTFFRFGVLLQSWRQETRCTSQLQMSVKHDYDYGQDDTDKSTETRVWNRAGLRPEACTH